MYNATPDEPIHSLNSPRDPRPKDFIEQAK